jgi:hypothetical protein
MPQRAEPPRQQFSVRYATRPVIVAKLAEARLLQLRQVKGKRRQGQAEALSDPSRRQPLRPGLDQQAMNLEPGFLSEGGKGGDGGVFFHISKYMETISCVKPASTSGILRRRDGPPLSRGCLILK